MTPQNSCTVPAVVLQQLSTGLTPEPFRIASLYGVLAIWFVKPVTLADYSVFPSNQDTPTTMAGLATQSVIW